MPQASRTAIILAALTLSACAATQAPASGAASGPPALAGTAWTLDSLDGAPPVAQSHPTLVFGADGRASGDASCNRFNGGWEASGASLAFSRMASTRRACLSPALSAQETRYLKALEGAATHRLEGGKLWIEGSGGRLAFAVDTASPRQVTFDCGNGDRLQVTFGDGTASLVDPQGRTARLVQQPAASGIWYEGEHHTLRGKGREMTWTFARMAPRACQAVD